MTQQQTAFRLEVMILQRRWQWDEVVLLQSVSVPIRFWSLTVAIALIIAFLLIVRGCVSRRSTAKLNPKIERESLRVHHANTEPFRLEKASFVVEYGKAATVPEPSAGEKTTLIKLMPALREAASGEGPIGDLPGPITGPRYRNQAAAIEQDESLLSGTISDNICLCNSMSNLDWMIRCMRPAHLDDAIMAMTMATGSWLASVGCRGVDGQ